MALKLPKLSKAKPMTAKRASLDSASSYKKTAKK